MRPENNTEFTNSINKMSPIIAGSKVIFIYNMGKAIDDGEDYMLMQNDAKKAMEDFTSQISKLSTGSIIDSSIEVLNPANTVIPMGSFNDRKVNYAEQVFNSALSEALKKSFSSASYEYEENEIKSTLSNPKNNQQAIVEYIKEICKKFHLDSNISTMNYVNHFLNEHHDRVKFNDGYSTYNIVNKNRQKLLKSLYECFNNLTVDNKNIDIIEKMLQETIIKYCYKKLTLAIKCDCGISKGNHPFESNPPITMWAEESVIADELLIANATSDSAIYCKIMQDKGFTSPTWNYVTVSNRPYSGKYTYCNYKLDVIHKCQLNSLPSKNVKELLYNSYNLALFRLGQFSIYDFVISTINTGDSAIDWL